MPGDRFIELARAEDRHVLDVMYRHAGEAVTVQDQEGHLVYANQRAADMIGVGDPQDILGDPTTEILADLQMVDENGAPLDPDTLPGRRVLAGDAVSELTVGYRRKGSGQVLWSRVRASPIKNDAGEVVWAINYFLDITEEMRRRDGERLMAKANEALGGSLDTNENLKALAGVIVPEIAAWCVIHLLDESGGLVGVADVSPSSSLAKPLFESAPRRRIPVDSDRLQARTLRSGRVEVISEVTDEMLDQASEQDGPELGALLRSLELKSVACVPLGVGRFVQGTLTVGRSRPDSDFDRTDLSLLRAIGDRAGLTLANAQRFQRDHETAEALRKGLAPRFLPEVPWLDLAARYRPLARAGHIGGDFYDVVPMTANQCAMLVGDIEGKGIQAAAAVGLARITLRATLNLDTSPKVLFDQLNEAQKGEDPARMCTLAYLLLTAGAATTRLEVALAGHPSPIILRADGRVETIGSPCAPAGLLPAIEPIVEEAFLQPGDTVIAFSDGFSVRDSDPVATMERMLAGREASSLDDLLDSLLDMLGGEKEAVRDDVALLAARVRPSR